MIINSTLEAVSSTLEYTIELRLHPLNEDVGNSSHDPKASDLATLRCPDSVTFLRVTSVQINILLVPGSHRQKRRRVTRPKSQLENTFAEPIRLLNPSLSSHNGNWPQYPYTPLNGSSVLRHVPFKDQEHQHGRQFAISDPIMLSEDTIVELIDAGFRRRICARPRKSQTGLKCRPTDSCINLTELSPALFSPGYSTQVANRAWLVPRLANILSSFCVFTSGSIKSMTSHPPRSILSKPEIGSKFEERDDITVEQIESNLWITLVNSLRDHRLAQRLDPIFQSTEHDEFSKEDSLQFQEDFQSLFEDFSTINLITDDDSEDLLFDCTDEDYASNTLFDFYETYREKKAHCLDDDNNGAGPNAEEIGPNSYKSRTHNYHADEIIMDAYVDQQSSAMTWSYPQNEEVETPISRLIPEEPEANISRCINQYELHATNATDLECSQFLSGDGEADWLSEDNFRIHPHNASRHIHRQYSRFSDSALILDPIDTSTECQRVPLFRVNYSSQNFSTLQPSVLPNEELEIFNLTTDPSNRDKEAYRPELSNPVDKFDICIGERNHSHTDTSLSSQERPFNTYNNSPDNQDLNLLDNHQKNLFSQQEVDNMATLQNPPDVQRQKSPELDHNLFDFEMATIFQQPRTFLRRSGTSSTSSSSGYRSSEGPKTNLVKRLSSIGRSSSQYHQSQYDINTEARVIEVKRRKTMDDYKNESEAIDDNNEEMLF